MESYFNALQRGSDAQGALRQVHLAGRYCDRTEKRAGASGANSVWSEPVRAGTY